MKPTDAANQEAEVALDGATCSDSGTPETDEQCMSNPYQGEVVKASFARKMERQRNALRKVQYPMECAEQLAECLIQHGLIEEAAWHDYEDYDRGITLGRVYKMQAACARIILPNV